MRFKQEDIGLYIAMMLLGAGAGLLLGSIIASRIQAKREAEAEKEMEENDVADEKWWDAPAKAKGFYVDEADYVMTQLEKVQKTEEDEEMEDLEAERLAALEIAEEEDYLIESQIEKFNARLAAAEDLAKVAIEKHSREKIKPRINKSNYTDKELLDFEATHEPKIYMVDMLWGGMMTFEQVLGVIEAEEAAMALEEQDYSGPYRNIFEDPPAVSDDSHRTPPPEPLTSAVYGIVDSRWTLMADPPDTYDEKLLQEIIYDPDEDAFFMLRKGNPIPFEIKTIGGESVWEKAQEYMDAYQREDIVIDDAIKPRWYIIHRVKSDAAEAAEDAIDESD